MFKPQRDFLVSPKLRIGMLYVEIMSLNFSCRHNKLVESINNKRVES